jgi:hypothetical protein
MSVRHQAPSGVSAREPLRRAASGLALLAVGLGGIGAALVSFDVSTRPPCKPGYVRLVDLEPVGTTVSLVLAGLALVLLWRSRRGSYLKLLTGMSVVVLVCAALVDLGAVANLVHHHGARYDDCWTF